MRNQIRRSVVPIFIRIAERLSVRKRSEDLPILRALVAPSSTIRLLDVGGGAGTATERFSEGCGEVTVLEPNRKKLVVGRKRRPALRFHEGRGESIPFPDDYFDRVVAVVSLHHADDQAQVLREMRRVLGRSGRLVLAELPHSRVPGLFGRWIGGHMHGSSLSFLEAPELKAKVEAAGFVDVAIHPGAMCYFVTASK
ncbi:MAG: methyltransferase domain-containing protein [Methanobacteriota archaeon]|nr:MAG: methyltransferase domain-containing protein [Euryarchaeota archaeon]TMA02112.1 MAG: methyltransferase domain-containing protein [Euryarchaeota archaeon]